jgi:N-methylhydantoinase B/oxoprolinase/acetone carboxylase alpha subunit
MSNRLDELAEKFGDDHVVRLVDKFIDKGLRSVERIEHYSDEEYEFFRELTIYMRECLYE